MNPRLSVITVCLNEAGSIGNTIESIISQTYQEFEWIIIDGGSEDGTLDLLEKYTSRIDKLISEKDKGIYDAMNKGIQNSSGEFLFFLNGGDYFYDKHILERVIPQLDTYGIYYGDIIVFDNNIKSKIITMPDRLNPEFIYYKTLPHQSTFIKRKLLLMNGGYDTSLRIAADYDLIVKLLVNKDTSFLHLDFPISYFIPYGISHDNVKREKEKRIVHRRYFTTLQRLAYSRKWCSRYLIARNHLGNFLLRRGY